MTARAMDNFGLSRLYLVNPRDKWPNKKADSSAKHAKNIIKNVKIFSNLEEATSKFNLVIATTNRQRFLTKKTYYNFNELSKKFNNIRNIAILFGPENSGLSNEDLRLANNIYTIKTARLNKSLNLSHAVSVIAYEIFSQNLKSSKITKKDYKIIDQKVTKSELSNYINFLIDDLENKGFFNPIEKKDSMIDNIYSIYSKMDLTKKELNMLWGMHKKLKNQPKI